MPNWCYNTLNVKHDDPAMIKRLVEAAEREELFNEFVTMPEDIRVTDGWYDWAVQNWGTKWDASVEDTGLSDDGTLATIVFNTAWSPPIPFYDELVSAGFDVDAVYTEEAQQFAGHFVNGDDNYVDLQFDDEKEFFEWMESIEDPVLRDLVQEEYDSWKSWQDNE